MKEHNRKVKKQAKKQPKSKKSKPIQIPNECPFKEDILKEVEAVKKHKEEERQKRRELFKLEKQKNLEEKKNVSVNMDTLVSSKFHKISKSKHRGIINIFLKIKFKK